jgi:RNA polymerase sigma-70 factor, ECF subfamily
MSADLIAALKRKEPAAFDRLVAQHGTMLYRMALRLMGQPEEAEEVVQETLLRVYEKIHTFEEHAVRHEAWLWNGRTA